jgi:hypothetical protein
MIQETFAPKELQESCQMWGESLTNEQKSLIRQWTGSGYRDFNNRINDWLRKQSYEGGMYSEEKTTDFLLVLSSAPQYTGELFRGTKKRPDNYSVGQELDIARLSSWSINPNAALTFTDYCEQRVLYRADTRGFYIDLVSTFGRNAISEEKCEDEVIIPPHIATVTNISNESVLRKKVKETFPRTPRVYQIRNKRSHSLYYMPLVTSRRKHTQTVYDFTNDTTHECKYSGVPQRLRMKRNTTYRPYHSNAKVTEITFNSVEVTIVDLEVRESWQEK